jgi:hypothetical protein
LIYAAARRRSTLATGVAAGLSVADGRSFRFDNAKARKAIRVRRYKTLQELGVNLKRCANRDDALRLSGRGVIRGHRGLLTLLLHRR